MSLGKELLQRRSELIEAERKLNENHNREVESQWKLIKHAIENTPITKDLKYVDLGYFPNIFKENIVKLHNEDFIVFQDKNKSIRLYFSEDDYKSDIENLTSCKTERNIDDVYGNLKSKAKMVNENLANSIKITKDNINSNKKSDFKINNNRQVEEDKKAETLKTECEKDVLAEFMENLTKTLNTKSTFRFY